MRAALFLDGRSQLTDMNATAKEEAMRAALFLDGHEDLVVDDVGVAAPIGREVLIQTAASGLCPNDLHFMETEGWVVPRPIVLGHEAAGVVEAVGPDVRDVQPGDHVICCLSVFCGRCEVCLSGQPYLCLRSRTECVRSEDQPARLSRGGQEVYQFANLSSFAEQMLVHENAVVKVRDDMSRLVDLYLDGRLMLDEMVSATIALDNVNDGFAAMKAGDVVRCVVAFN